MQKRLVHNRNTRSAAASAAASVAASIATGSAFVFGCAAVLRALCLLMMARLHRQLGGMLQIYKAVCCPTPRWRLEAKTVRNVCWKQGRCRAEICRDDAEQRPGHSDVQSSSSSPTWRRRRRAARRRTAGGQRHRRRPGPWVRRRGGAGGATSLRSSSCCRGRRTAAPPTAATAAAAMALPQTAAAAAACLKSRCSRRWRRALNPLNPLKPEPSATAGCKSGRSSLAAAAAGGGRARCGDAECRRGRTARCSLLRAC